MLPTFDFISNHIASTPSTCRSVLAWNYINIVLEIHVVHHYTPSVHIPIQSEWIRIKTGVFGTRWFKWVSVKQTIPKSSTICTMSSILFLKLLILRWHILIDDWSVRVVSPCVGPGFCSISPDSNKHNFIKQIIKAILMTLPWKIRYDSKTKYRQYLTNK